MNNYLDSVDHKGKLYKYKDYDLTHPDEENVGKFLMVVVGKDGIPTTEFKEIDNLNYIKIVDIVKNYDELVSYNTTDLKNGDKIEVLSNNEQQDAIYNFNKDLEEWEIYAIRESLKEKVDQLDQKIDGYYDKEQNDKLFETKDDALTKYNNSKKYSDELVNNLTKDAPEEFNTFKGVSEYINSDISAKENMTASINLNKTEIDLLKNSLAAVIDVKIDNETLTDDGNLATVKAIKAYIDEYVTEAINNALNNK